MFFKEFFLFWSCYNQRSKVVNLIERYHRENVNRHTMHYWANENPRLMKTVLFQYLRKLSAKRTASINGRRDLVL